MSQFSIAWADIAAQAPCLSLRLLHLLAFFSCAGCESCFNPRASSAQLRQHCGFQSAIQQHHSTSYPMHCSIVHQCLATDQTALDKHSVPTTTRNVRQQPALLPCQGRHAPIAHSAGHPPTRPPTGSQHRVQSPRLLPSSQQPQHPTLTRRRPKHSASSHPPEACRPCRFSRPAALAPFNPTTAPLHLPAHAAAPPADRLLPCTPPSPPTTIPCGPGCCCARCLSQHCCNPPSR